MNSIVEMFKENNLIKRNKPNYSRINSITLSKFIDLNKELDELIKSESKPVKRPTSSFAADPDLGGSAAECSNLPCRLKRVDKLARYALLYSDEVYIESYFSKYLCLDQWKGNDFNDVKTDFVNDLIVFRHISPLLEKGIIKLFSPNREVCFTCQAIKYLGKKAGEKFERARKKLEIDILNNISVSCQFRDNEYHYHIKGSENFFNHGLVYIDGEADDALKERRALLKRIKQGSALNLSKTVTKELQFNHDLLHKFIHNSIFGLSTSYGLNTSFLTGSEHQIKFINSLNPKQEIKANNIISSKYLSHVVPFIQDVNLKDLIKLRGRENEAFLNYRAALNETLTHYKNVKGKLTDAEAKEFYHDILEPELGRLNLKVKKAKRDLINKPIRSVVGIVGVISFGLLAGIFPENLAEVVKVIGLTKFGSDLIKDTIAIDDTENAISDDKYYFLWKVKSLAKE